MDGLAQITEAMRKMVEAYAEALTLMARTVQELPHQDGEAYRRMTGEWIRLARASKDGFVAALDQAFELWERECRRTAATAAPGAAAGTPTANPMEAWAESWKRAVEAFTRATLPGEAGAAEARRQAQSVQQAILDGAKAWQALWPPSAGRA